MTTTDLHREYLHELKLGKLYSLDRPGRSLYSEPDLKGAMLGHIHHGKIAMMIGKHIDPFGKLGITITHGVLSPTEEGLDSQPAGCVEISQEAIWAFLGNGKSAAMKYLRISGDVELAADLNRLATDLHWELEEDLSKIIGDQAAFAVHQQAKKVVEQGQEAVKDLQVGVRDYLVFEK